MFLDGHRALWTEVEGIPANAVASVRLLSPVEAATEYGPLSGVDAILDVRLHHPST